MKKNIFLFFLKSEKTFIIFGVVFGLLFSLITPPFQVPDEYNHFYRAFQISELKIVAERTPTQIGGLLPKSLVTTSEKIPEGIFSHPEVKQKPENILSLLNLPLESDSRVFVPFPNTSLYSPIPYLPQATGIATGKIFKLSPIILMYIGRICNLLAWVFLIYLSIKFIPVSKWLFFLLALTPMSLFQASSLSADAVTNGLSFLLTSLFLHYSLVENKNINQVDISLLFLVSILLSLSKTVYFIMILMYFLIPQGKIGNKKKYLTIFALLVLLNLGVIAIWSSMIKSIYAHIPLLPSISPTEQLLFIFAHPLRFAKVIVETVSVYGNAIIKEFIGVLGWLDTALPEFQISSYLIMLFLVAVASNQKNILMNYQQKFIIFSIFLMNIFVVSLTLYLSWTSVGGNRIEGLQGRYFIPVFPLFLLLFYNKIFPNISKITIWVIGYSLFSNILTTYVLLHRYYF